MGINIESPGGDADELKAALRALLNDYESVSSGADPEVIDPDVALTLVTTGATKGTETITLADPTEDAKPFFKTILFSFSDPNDAPTLETDNSVGFISPLAIKTNDTHAGFTAALHLVWNPSLSAWQALVGGPIYTNGGGISIGSGTVDAGLFAVDSIDGAIGGTFTSITSITVKDGLVTAISGTEP